MSSEKEKLMLLNGLASASGQKKQIRVIACKAFVHSQYNCIWQKLYLIRFFTGKRKVATLKVMLTRDKKYQNPRNPEELHFWSEQVEGYCVVYVAEYRFCEKLSERAFALCLHELGYLKSLPKYQWNLNLCEKVKMPSDIEFEDWLRANHLRTTNHE